MHDNEGFFSLFSSQVEAEDGSERKATKKLIKLCIIHAIGSFVFSKQASKQKSLTESFLTKDLSLCH